MIRHIDELGRLVIPIEIRNQLDIDIHDGVNISVDNEKIIIEKSDFYRCEHCLTSISRNDCYCRNCGKEIQKKGKIIPFEKSKK